MHRQCSSCTFLCHAKQHLGHRHQDREGFDMKGKQFRKHVRALAKELSFDNSYLDRELGVGFSGGEKKKLEMLQLLLLEPKLAILDETFAVCDHSA